ncbi:MAG TPA: TolC family protein [Spirochaetota bacterium]|nr:TolC family protein [Spirochaetota bacterium]
MYKIIKLVFLIISLLHGRDKIISIQDFAAACLEKHPEYQQELINLDLEKNLGEQLKSIYDVYLTGQLFYNYKQNEMIKMENLQSSVSNSIKEKELTNLGFNLSLQGQLPFAGTSYSLGYTVPKTVSVNRISPFKQTTNFTAYNPYLSFRLSQPLLKNWFGVLDRHPLRQQQLDRQIASITTSEAAEELLSTIYNMYIDWYSLHNRVRILTESLSNSYQLQKSFRQKQVDGVAEKSELSEVREMVLEYEKNLVFTAAELKSMQQRIYAYYTGRAEAAPAAIKPSALVELPGLPEEIIPAAARQMKILELTRRLLTNEYQKELNAMLPELNAFLDIKLSGFNLKSESDRKWGGLEYKDFKTGLNIAYPLGNKKQRAQRRAAKMKLKRWALEQKYFIFCFILNADQLKRRITACRKILQIDKKLITELELQIKEENKKYKQGRGDLYFIIEKKNKLLNQQLTALEDNIRLLKLKIEYLAMGDKLYNK